MRRPINKEPGETSLAPLPKPTHQRLGIPVRQYRAPTGNDCNGNSLYASITIPAFGICDTDSFRRDFTAHVATQQVD